MEKRTFLCDHCGNEMNERQTSSVVVLVAEDIAPKVQAPMENLLSLSMWGAQRPRHREERFQFCVECALGLLIGLKARKVHIQKHGRVVRM